MARPKTGDKPKEIRTATVAEVVAVGSTAVSVNKIADRASLSVGTLYRYHRTKDDLLFAVFLEIKRDIHMAMMREAKKHVSAASRLRAMWFALVDYGFRLPGEFRLAEMMAAETRAQLSGSEELESMHEDILAEIQSGIDDGILVDAPAQTIELLLASPAVTLARRAAFQTKRPDPNEVSQVFDLVWRGVAKS